MSALLQNYIPGLGPQTILPTSIVGFAGFTGNYWYVKPSTGSDSNVGNSPSTAFKTLSHALSQATANNNDVIFLIAESDTAGSTTDYQTTTLNWNKSLTHLIGIGGLVDQRSRIAAKSTATGVAPVVTLSANDCYFSNIEIYGGVSGDATSFGAMSITGNRNYFENVTFYGIGGSDAVTAGAYNVKFSASTLNTFVNCIFGNDNVSIDNSTQGEIYFAGTGANTTSKIRFINCVFRSWISNAGYLFVTFAGTTSIDRTIEFTNCQFYAQSTNDATALTQVFGSMDGFTQGYVSISNSTVFSPGATTAVWIDTGTNRLKVANGGTVVKTGGEAVIVN
jgi:hypothetical protein